MFLILERVADQTNAHLPTDERMKVSPHVLQHTFMRTLAEEKEGTVHEGGLGPRERSIHLALRQTQPAELSRRDRRTGRVTNPERTRGLCGVPLHLSASSQTLRVVQPPERTQAASSVPSR